MPLSPELEALLATEKDEAKRGAMKKELEDGYRRQADYSRAMNELAAQKKEWQTWHANADKQYKDALAEVKSLRDTVTTLEKAKAEAADNNGGGLPDDDDGALSKALREARTELTEARKRQSQLEETVSGIDKMLKDGKLLTAEQFEEKFTKGLDNAGAAMFEILDKQNQYRVAYGKELDRNLLIEEAQKRGGDLNSAYEFLTQKDREEKLRKDLEAEYEQKYQDRLRTANLPVDQNSGEVPTGAIQSFIQQKKDGSIADDIPADGSGRLASVVAAELKSEGKF